ncbi:MAG: MFS transporter [Bacteroidetes bacterium]|nr:MFS transporter [Bacteroidota bacterium]
MFLVSLRFKNKLIKNQRAIFLLLAANSISGVAQGISMLAVPWYFTGILQRADLFAVCYLVITAASLFWGVYSGALIDRHSRKSIFLWLNAGGLLALAGVSLYGYMAGQLHWLAVISVFATTVFVYTVHFPNLYAFAQEITPRHDYARITSLLEIQGQITFTVAGGLAAALLQGFDGHLSAWGNAIQLPFQIKAWSIQQIFLVNTLTYAITLLLVWRIQSMPVVEKKMDTAPLPDRLKSGFVFLQKHPLLFQFGNASLLVFLTVLVFGTYVSTVFVKNYLQGDGAVYALSDMAFSVGSLLAGFLTTRVFGEKNAVKGIIILSLVAAGLYAFMTVNRVFVLFYLANFLIGSCNAAVRIQRITFLFHHIPNHIIGRTNSVLFVVSVLFRLGLIAVLNLPFFLQGEQIKYAVWVLAGICATGGVLLARNYKQLLRMPDVPRT